MAAQDTLQPGSRGQGSSTLTRDVADGFRQNLFSMVVPAEASIARASNGAVVMRLPS
jgi:hypothetical protein